MYFGKRHTNLFQPTLNDIPLEWVTQWKYLGVHLNSHKKFDCSILNRVKKFYKNLNAILRIEGQSDEMIMLRLIKSHCIPILTYAIAILEVANASENGNCTQHIIQYFESCLATVSTRLQSTTVNYRIFLVEKLGKNYQKVGNLSSTRKISVMKDT